MSLLSRGSLLRLFLLPPPPLISSRVFSTRVFIASLFFSPPGRDNHPWIGFASEIQIHPTVSKIRAKTNWNYCIGECTGLLISVPFKGRGGRGEKRSPKGFQIARFAQFLLFQSCPWKTISILFSLSLFFFTPRNSPQAFISPFSISGLEIHPILVREDFNLVWSRYRHVLIFLSRYSRATCSPSLRFPLSHSRNVRREREKERERGKWSMSIYRSVRANRVQPRRKFPVASAGNSWNEGPSHPSSIHPLFFRFFLSFTLPLFLSLFPKIHLLQRRRCIS